MHRIDPQEQDDLIDHIAARLGQAHVERIHRTGNGGCASFDEYRRAVGQAEGLLQAIDILRAVQKQLHSDDEDEDGDDADTQFST